VVAALTFKTKLSWQTSRPERTRSLPNRYLYGRDIDLSVQTLSDLGLAGVLKEQLERLLQMCSCLLDGLTLAGDGYFGAEGNKTVVLAFDQSGKSARCHAILHNVLTRRGQCTPV
jgi:hypothetical protein